MENSVNMDVMRDKMLGSTQNQTLTETGNEEEFMDIETSDEKLPFEGKDVPIDYSSSSNRGVPREQPLDYKGGYGAEMKLNEDDVNRFTSHEIRSASDGHSKTEVGNKEQMNWGPPPQSQGKLRDLDLSYADPNLLSRSAP